MSREVEKVVNEGDAMRPDEIAGLRQAARQRRAAWARRRLVPPPTEHLSDPRDAPAAPVEARSTGWPNNRTWSVNVELVDRERLLRGWTQRELARRARVDQGTLTDLLARRRRPTLGTVRAICSALSLAMEQVIAFDDGVR